MWLTFIKHLLCATSLLLLQSTAFSAPVENANSASDLQLVLTPEASKDIVVTDDRQEIGDSFHPTAIKPVYAIAHRVLSDYGVRAALSHGANAIEMDMTAWWNSGPVTKQTGPGWWADHDGRVVPVPTWGASAHDIFKVIAEQHMSANRTVTFVWLDIKTPDYCDPNKNGEYRCSISYLRDLAREILEPAGIRVLYGFYDKPGIGYKAIASSLNSNEAMNYDGTRKNVLEVFNGQGPTQVFKRIYSYGYFNIGKNFGNCNEKEWYTCTELRQAATSKAFGKVFGWTSLTGTFQYGGKELDNGVDGLIYGCRANAEYTDEDCARQAGKDIENWVQAHADTHRMATQQDLPW